MRGWGIKAICTNIKDNDYDVSLTCNRFIITSTVENIGKIIA